MRQADDTVTGGTRVKRHDLYLAIAVGMFLVGGTVLGFAATRSEPYAERAPSAPSALPVATLTAKAQPGYEARRLFVGRLEPRRQSAVGFELGGLLRSVRVDEGDQVQAGELLALLDTARLRASRRELAAALDEAEANRPWPASR